MIDMPPPIIPVHTHGRLTRILKKTFFSLRNRNFRLYFIGQMISNTGNWLTNVALTLFMLKLTDSGFEIGMLAACQFGPMFFLSAWAGAIADRSDKRRMLLLTQGLELAQSIGLAIVAFMSNPSIIALYVLAIGGGIVLAFDSPLRRSFVSEMVPIEDLPNAVVVYSTVVNISRIFGPALAGLLVVTVGYGWCFTIDALSYLAVLYCLSIMEPEKLYRHPPKPRSKGEIREGLYYVISTPMLWISFVMLAAIGMLPYNFTVSLPLFVTEALHSSDGVFTILYSVFSFGAVVSSLVVAHRSFVRMRHIITGASALGFSMLLLALMPEVKTATIAVFLVGAASILYMTATTTIVQVETRRGMHGRMLALQTMLMGGTGIIGGPLSGLIADAMGGRAPILLGGITCILAATFGYFMSKEYDCWQ